MPSFVLSNVEDCCRIKLINSAPQIVIEKLSKRKDVYRDFKANPAVLTGTGIPLGSPIFVNQSLRRYYKFYGPNLRNSG